MAPRRAPAAIIVIRWGSMEERAHSDSRGAGAMAHALLSLLACLESRA